MGRGFEEKSKYNVDKKKLDQGYDQVDWGYSKRKAEEKQEPSILSSKSPIDYTSLSQEEVKRLSIISLNHYIDEIEEGNLQILNLEISNDLPEMINDSTTGVPIPRSYSNFFSVTINFQRTVQKTEG